MSEQPEYAESGTVRRKARQMRPILTLLGSLISAWWATWPYFSEAALARDITAIWGVYGWLLAHPLRLVAFLPFFIWFWLSVLRVFAWGPYADV